MIVQIYAHTDPMEAAWAASIGVDHVGFVVGDYGIVHAELSFEGARAIVRALPPACRSVALTMSADVDEILEMILVVQPSILHISTDPLQVPPGACHYLRESLPPEIALMKAIPVIGEPSIGLAREFHSSCDYLILDTKTIGMPGVGATGKVHDWEISRRIVEESPVPVILAGGLDPTNVAHAVEVVQPFGVDSNTGTNVEGDPVRKDRKKVQDFVRAASGGMTAAHE
jgi:phosphoribosylanthranilate isomerase